MKNFILHKEDFINQPELTYVHVNKNTWTDFQKDIMLTLIEHFNKEYTWSQMFDIQEVSYRIEKDEDLFIMFYGDQPIGYVFFKKLDEKTGYSYNFYVTKLVERPKTASYWFWNKTHGFMLNKFNMIKCESDDWNTRAHDIFFKTGFKEI